MRERKPDLDVLRAHVVVVSFDPPERLAVFAADEDLPFEVLSDPERRLYRALGMARRTWWRLLTPRIVWLYLRRLGRARLSRLAESDGQQLGGDVVLDRQGRIVYLHRSETAEDRPTVDELLAALGADR